MFDRYVFVIQCLCALFSVGKDLRKVLRKIDLVLIVTAGNTRFLIEQARQIGYKSRNVCADLVHDGRDQAVFLRKQRYGEMLDIHLLMSA